MHGSAGYEITNNKYSKFNQIKTNNMDLIDNTSIYEQTFFLTFRREGVATVMSHPNTLISNISSVRVH